MHQIESPLHQHNEQAPIDVDMVEKFEVKSAEEIIRDKEEEIT